MKKLIAFGLIIVNSTLFAQESGSVYVLSEPLVVGLVDKSDRVKIEVDKEKLVKTMNSHMSKNLQFDSVYIEKIDFDQKKFYFLMFKAKQSNKVLVRWLSQKGTSLIVENTQEKEYTSLNTYFECEGETSCYPRLKKMEGRYYWSCRELDGCVSDAYAEAHPCICTKSIISK